MPALNPDHLLEQADQLIATPGPGAPKQADLRRAISTAYYALFHAIATATADDFAGKTNQQTARYGLVYRSVGHRALRDLSDDVQKQNLPARYSALEPPGGFGTDMIAVATALSDLQEKRHSADYDPLFRVRASDATLAIVTARTALRRFRSANAQKPKAFISLIVFKPR
jgi:hypothetical protein